jgi:hypothetical protein
VLGEVNMLNRRQRAPLRACELQKREDSHVKGTERTAVLI